MGDRLTLDAVEIAAVKAIVMSVKRDVDAEGGRPLPRAVGWLADAAVEVSGAIARSSALSVALDPDGRIVAHNEMWLEEGLRNGLDAEAIGVGADYLGPCAAATGSDVILGRRAADGIRSVIAGDQRSFTLDYPCHGPNGQRWFTLRAKPLGDPGSGALVSHIDITRVREAELAVGEQVGRVWEAAEADSDFVLLLDPRGQIIDARTAGPSGIGISLEAGEPIADAVHADDIARIGEMLDHCLAAPDASSKAAVRLKDSQGGYRHVVLEATNLLDDADFEAVVVAGRDTTERIRASVQELVASTVLKNLPVAAAVVDESSVVIMVNDTATQMLGQPRDELLGRPLRGALRARDSQQAVARRTALASGGAWVGELDLQTTNGMHSMPVWLRAQPLEDPQTGFVGVSYFAIDRTEQRLLRDALVHRLQNDALTGLPNRDQFLRHVRSLVDQLEGDDGGAVALVSIDRFSEVNVAFGTTIGDQTLKRVGDELRTCAGASGMVSRLYGDVFAVATPCENPLTLAADVRDAVHRAGAVDDVDIELRASVGVRVLSVTNDHVDAETLVDEAAVAAAEARAAGGDRSRFYDETLRRMLRERSSLRRDLPGAIDRGEMTVEYQPVIRIADGTVTGVEALVRWNHPDRGRIGPDRFVPIAESTGFIHELGAFVMDDVCRHAARWRDLRPEMPPRVAVNISPAQLADPNLVERVENAIALHHLDPGLIAIELTESMLMDAAGIAGRRLAQLKAVGVRVAIDDFGTEYSSLSKLKHLPLDVLKIDRSFVTDAAGQHENAAIARAVVDLADAVGLDVVAEGVESEEDARTMWSVGCTQGQGFHWSPAVPPHEIDPLLETGYPPLPESATDPLDFDRVAEVLDALRVIQHEMATPLAVLNASVRLLDEPTTDREDLNEMIVWTVQRMTWLVQSLDLLDRLDRGTLEVSRGETDVGSLVQQVADEVSSHLRRPIGVTAPVGAEAMIDGPLVGHVVSNLLNNAIKYSPDRTPVTVAVETAASMVIVSVHDVGVGIPMDRVGTIWRKFGRLDHATPGSGIGLYLARGIARAHGGELRYRPNQPTGSVFTLELPVS